MKATDFEFIEKGKRGWSQKYDGLAFVGVYDGVVYISARALGLLDVRKDEGIRLAKRPGSFFMFRAQAGEKNAYKLSDRGTGGKSISAGRLASLGLEKGDYILLDPVHVEGLDLFELVPASEYQNRIAA